MSSDRSAGGDAAPQREAALALRFPVSDLGDGDRQQLPLAQQLAHVLDGVAFDDARCVPGRRCRERCIRKRPWRLESRLTLSPRA